MSAQLGLIVGVVVCIVAVLTVTYYNRRIDRVRKSLPADAWACACVDPKTPRRWCALIIDATGLSIVRSNGQSVHRWAWAEITSAHAGSVAPAGAVVSHSGLVLTLSDASERDLLLPSRTTMRYPPDLVESAIAEIDRRRGRP